MEPCQLCTSLETVLHDPHCEEIHIVGHHDRECNWRVNVQTDEMVGIGHARTLMMAIHDALVSMRGCNGEA